MMPEGDSRERPALKHDPGSRGEGEHVPVEDIRGLYAQPPLPIHIPAGETRVVGKHAVTNQSAGDITVTDVRLHRDGPLKPFE